jgi:glutathione synthase/RimK-type ligase-like ATP-grasp enzyme
MPRCCFLSMDSLDGYVSDDELAVGPFRELGWDVVSVSWRDGTADWDGFDAVIVRTTWDYQDDAARFLEVLHRIDRSEARLENPLPVMEWNLDKRYLAELERDGVRIVPTVWRDTAISESEFAEWQLTLDAEELIVKPTVSATAQDTFRLRKYDPQLGSVFRTRAFMVQPFITAIVDEGEYSLFYFDGRFSHAIVKKPKKGDFRVQEEHGGIISKIEPDIRMRSAADSIAARITPTPLYSRIDLVRDRDNEFALMEMELIEPALYFRMDPPSARRFADAFVDRFERA